MYTPGDGRHSKRWGRYAALLAALVVLVACGNGDTAETTSTSTVSTSGGDTSQPDSSSTTPEASDTLRIGVAVSKSGDLAELGSRVERGYQFWADTLNDAGGIDVGGQPYSVELVIYDDESDPTTSARLAERLISEDQVDFMFGPFGSTATLAVAEITDRNNVLLLACCGSADSIYEQGYTSLFGALAPASTHPTFWLDAMATQGATTVGIMTLDDLFPTLQRDALIEFAEGLGVEVVFNETYPADQTSFATLVTQLANAAPQALAVLGYTEDATAIIRDMRDQRFYPSGVFFSGPALGVLDEAMGEVANYSYGATFWNPQFEWEGPLFGTAAQYADAFEAEYGFAPTYQEPLAGSVGEVLTAALEAAGTLSVDAVIEELRSGQFETTGAGLVSYDEAGRNITATVGVEQLVDGKINLVFVQGQDAPDAIVFPAPGWDERG